MFIEQIILFPLTLLWDSGMEWVFMFLPFVCYLFIYLCIYAFIYSDESAICREYMEMKISRMKLIWTVIIASTFRTCICEHFPVLLTATWNRLFLLLRESAWAVSAFYMSSSYAPQRTLLWRVSQVVAVTDFATDRAQGKVLFSTQPASQSASQPASHLARHGSHVRSRSFCAP